MLDMTAKRVSMIVALLSSTGALAQVADAGGSPAAQGPSLALDDIIVTAQRRATDLQDTPVAISAFSGQTLDAERVLSFEDLAARAPSLSFTALSPLDQEFNIRGITNTRLDSPSADQSIGIFFDDVYVGRSGLFNFDMYDIERVEVIRGPQGVLLGRNVVGGAISIYAARPKQDFGASGNISYGNFNEVLLRGHVTGGLSEALSARVAFQYRNRDGFNRDILNNVDLDDVDSIQFRGSLLFEPVGSDFNAILTFDYTNDKSNGFHSVAIDGPPAGAGPWSTARVRVGEVRGRPLDIREGLPEWPQYKGDAEPTPQQLRREAWGLMLRAEKTFGTFATLTSITGYRHGDAFNVYAQTGIGPNNGFGVISPTLFRSDVNEREKIDQFSQELRLVSQKNDLGFDWILGAYFQYDKVRKDDTIIAEVPLIALVTLSGESEWRNRSKNESQAVFGQIGYRFSDSFRVNAGVRYSHDIKAGVVSGFSVEGGDRFNPNDLVAVTPLAATFREGQGYVARYKDSWSELTPQVTAEFKPNDNLLFYATWATGYKGGGFEDDPANAIAAVTSYDPETVENIELGAKLDLFDRRVRFNVAAFDMRYKNLQVTQTDAGCLCNITDNAADAKIRGFELEGTVAVASGLTLFGGVTYLDTEYIAFIDSVGRDNSGNFLQRTPEYQWNIGGEFVTDIGSWDRALAANVNYTYQGKMFWAPDNLQTEPGFGQLNARVALTIANSPVTVSIWGRNLTDTLFRTNIIAFFGDEISRLGPPRTYGVEVGFRF